jgi:replicative DNA helicase
MRAAKGRKITAPKVDLELFVLPHNLEAERATIGAALVSSAAADYLADTLTRGAYFRRAHQVIFEAIKQLREERIGVDFVTLKTKLAAMVQLDEVGGPAALAALADGVPRSSNVEYYAGILKDLEVKRELVHFAHRVIDNVGAGEHSSAALVEDADWQLMELQAGHVDGRMRSLRETTGALAKDLEWRVEHQGKLTGIETGFPSINAETLGWQRGDLIIVAARPSIGKTAFILNSVRAAAAGGPS